MRILIAVYAVLFILCVKAHAFVIDSHISISNDGSYFQEIALLCEQNESVICQATCGDALMCLEPEPLCLNCAGTSSDILRAVFSKLPVFFEASVTPIKTNDIVNFLSKQNYILLSTKSIYNFFSPFDSEQLRAQFQAFCPAGSQLPHLAAILNNRGEPSDVVYAFCQVGPTETAVFPVFSRVQDAKKLTPRPRIITKEKP